MQKTAADIKNFLQYIALQFIKHPQSAQLKLSQGEDNTIRFRLILHKEDVATLIGRNGFTASSIRNVIKAAAQRDGVNATLQIVSTEEEEQRLSAIAS
jgi:uncharacterized protein